MAKDNPTNPYTSDPTDRQKDIQMPIAKGEVIEAYAHPEGNGFHTVRVQMAKDNTAFVAPVLTPTIGSVWVPKEGTDVAVLFDDADKPWVIGSWYPIDRVRNEEVEIPQYEPGDIRLGNESGYIQINKNGSIDFGQNERKNIVLETGVTSDRPNNPVEGQEFFDTDLGQPIWYDGTNWVDADGSVV